MKETKWKRLIRFLTNPDYRFESFGTRGYLKNMPDDVYLSRMFKAKVGYPLNLTSPKTFNEKLQWLKLHDRKPIYTTMVDKYAVKDYVASIIGEQYIIPTLGVWDNFDDIDFDALPNQFVLKCTHDSGGLVICKDKSKLDIKKAKKKINKSLHRNYYYMFREWPYKDVKPRIIAEKYMEDESGYELKDYKVFNFDGEPKMIQVDYGRFSRHMRNLYTTDWKYIEASIEYPTDPKYIIEKPEALEKMLELARTLSKGISHARTDFYSIDEKLYFGEITFYHGSGFEKFTPKSFENQISSWLKLPGGGYLLKEANFYVWVHRQSELKNKPNSKALSDYKVHSFNGVPKVILVCKDRFSELGLTEDFFDENWTHLDVRREKHPNSNEEIARPAELDKMLELAEALSKDVPFLRSDFYTIDGKVYFGELTFFPASGFEGFKPESFDKTLGDWLALPTEGGVLLVNGNCYVLLACADKAAPVDKPVTTDKEDGRADEKPLAEAPRIRDYKIYTFGGKAKICVINQDRGVHTRGDFFDKDFNWLDFTWGFDHADVIPEKPKNYEKMFELAEKLAAGTYELRVDFYEVDGAIYFGELTFFDGSGFDKIEPKEWDELLGSWVQLPIEKKK